MAVAGLSVEFVSLVTMVGAVALSLAILLWLDDDSLLAPLQERFVLGVPWGTVAVVVGVSAFYYLVQGGGSAAGPIVDGFRSWSLWYPQGVLFSSFAHSSEAHLTGNMLGTVAVAPIAEYAWGHYGDEWPSHPAARIGLFVAGIALVGLAGSVFVPGAVIGFSGVVFALAGFALVARPLAAVFAMLGLQVVRLVYAAVRNPQIVAQARTRFISPSWAEIALQGHLFGLLIGILLAVALVRLRDKRPDPRYVWFAALAFAVVQSLYAVYWFRGSDQFVLFRALGTAGVFVLAAIAAVAVLPPSRRSRVGPAFGTVAVGLLVATLCALAVSGLAYNLVSVSPGEPVEDGVAVGDYTVDYVENTEDRYVAAVTVPGAGSPLSTSVSGVVVASDRRNAWGVALSARELAFQGRATIPVGGATWRETVVVNRTGWRVVGGNSTYRVTARHDGDRDLLYTADPAVARVRVNGSRVRIEPSADFYDVVVTRNGSALGVERVPADGTNATVAGLRFERDGTTLLVHHDDTTVRLGKYRIRRRG